MQYETQTRTKSTLESIASELADLIAGVDPQTEFRAKYARDPLGFVLDCVGFESDERPTQYQQDILSSLVDARRVAVRGPHGIGKTTLAAWVVLWGALTAPEVKVVTTASAWRQLSKYLWPEIHKWARRLRWDVIGRGPLNRNELLALSLSTSDLATAFAVASDNPALIEGAHARRMIYVYDEAKAIPDATWDAAEGAFSGAGADTGNEAYALAISTPGEPSGRFYEICSRSSSYAHWTAVHVSVEDAISAGRVSREWVDLMRQQWGATDPRFVTRVLGEFAAGETDGLIPLSWVEAAIDRWLALEETGQLAKLEFVGVGVDVARQGADKTVLAFRFGDAITRLDEYVKQDTMATTGRVKAVIDQYGPKAIIDVIGFGAGVIDRLREQGYKDGIDFDAFNAAEKTALKDVTGTFGFANKRSAAWWGLRERLDPSRGATIALPPHDGLIGDLTTPSWKLLSDGRIKVEEKDEVRKRLGRSTDYADAVMQAFWLEQGSGPLFQWIA